MPRGLPSVEQQFTADVSGYLEGIQKMIDANQRLIGSIEAVKRVIDSLPDTKRIAIEVTGADGAIQKIRELKTELAGLGDRTIRFGTSGIADQFKQQADAAEGAVTATRKLASAQGETAAASDSAGRSVRSLADDLKKLQSENEKTDLAFQRSAISLESGLGTYGRRIEATQRLINQIERDMQPILLEKAALESGIGPGTRAPGGTGESAAIQIAAAAAIARAGGGGFTSFLAGGGMPPFGPLWGSASPGGSDGGAGNLMTASMYAGSIITWVKRFAGIAHYAIMGTMEALSTIVPAGVALAGAGAVGMQGAEQLINRGQAIYSTAEALGGPFGTSFGALTGLGGGLQQAQNQFGGGVYGLTGGLMQLIGMGQGGFLGMGGQTMMMANRGMADMILNAQQRGTFGTLGQVLGGGTGYLRQFGDIGANLGNFLLGMAPNLPGVGGMMLSGLEGITGGMSWLAHTTPGPLLGGLMAGEAGWRLGTPLLGLAGRGLGGLGGLAARAGLGSLSLTADQIASIAASSGVDASLIEGGGTGLAGLLEGAGAGLGGLTGVAGAGLGLSAFALARLAATMPTAEMRQIAAMQAGISGQPFTAAFQPLAHALTWAVQQPAGLPSTGLAGSVAQNMPMMETPSQYARFGPQAGMGPSAAQAYRDAAQSWSQQLGTLAGGAPQLVAALAKMGVHGASFADALQIATASLLDVTHAFKGGKLTAQAAQQMQDFMTAVLGPQAKGGAQLTGAPSVLLAAAGAQTIMGSSQMKALQQVNQAFDQMTQIMTGGPVGQSTLFGMLGGTPVTRRRAGLQLQAPPAYAAMAQALTSFMTPGGAAAWQTFAGPQGLVPAMQQNLDQLRTYMVLGGLNQQQAAGVAGFDLQQLLPLARRSPAALATLMSMGAQAGVGGYYQPGIGKTPDQTQAMNYQAAVQAFAAMAASAKQVNSYMNQAVVHTANIPNVAKQFLQQLGPSAQAQQLANITQAGISIDKAMQTTGKIPMPDLSTMIAAFRAAGVKGGTAMAQAVDAALKVIDPQIPPGALSKINAAITQSMSNVKDKKITLSADDSQAVAAAKRAQQAEQLLKDKKVALSADASQAIAAARAAAAAIAAVQSKTVTLTAVYNTVYTQTGSPGLAAMAQANVSKLSGHQTGGLVPGTGSGDIIPALLEPGEAVVPRGLVPLIAPILAAHRVPGFGGPASFSAHFAAGGLVSGSERISYDGKQFAFTLIDEITKALKTAGAAKIAQALTSQISTEVKFAKSTAASAVQGLNLSGMDVTTTTVAQNMQDYLTSVKSFTTDLKVLSKQGLNKDIVKQLIAAGPVVGDQLAQSILHGMKGQIAKNAIAGLNLAGMDVTPGTGGGTVTEQMQGYLGSMKSFTSDLKTLGKQGLSKQIMQQLISAGPVQGDALAQSILNDYGGTSMVNSLWKQINQQAGKLGQVGAQAYPFGVSATNQLWKQLGISSNALGAQAAMSMYGGVLAPNLKSGTFTTNNNHVTVNIETKGGTTLDLTPAQVKQLTELFQEKLLMQARRNQKTGIQAPGKGA